jgi:hypothetical protein
MGKFNLGDRVVVNDTGRDDAKKVNGKHGIIVDVFSYRERYGVKFDENFGGHDLCGKCPNGYGWNVNGEDLKLEKEEKKMGKFNVGDRVMVRFWDDMAAEFGLYPDGCCGAKSGTSAHFTPSMKHLCGRQATISEVSSEDIYLKDWSDKSGDISWNFNPFMFCLVKKAEPKKKLSVAEIEKLLGYGVEVVKEGK